MSFSITMKGADLMLDELADEALDAARPAAQAGAQVLYDQVRANVQRLPRRTGKLLRSIYQKYLEDEAAPGRSSYRISWRKKRDSGESLGSSSSAPHGWLVEFGHLQRYEIGRDARGRYFALVRPEMKGKPKPDRKASQAVKDAYYVPRKGGPLQIPGKAFLRSAWSRAPQAQAAMEKRFFEELQRKGLIK
jgi:hypothetical protein